MPLRVGLYTSIFCASMVHGSHNISSAQKDFRFYPSCGHSFQKINFREICNYILFLSYKTIQIFHSLLKLKPSFCASVSSLIFYSPSNKSGLLSCVRFTASSWRHSSTSLWLPLINISGTGQSLYICGRV